MKYKRKINIIILILIIAFVVINAKSIGRIIYPVKYSNYISEYSKKYGLEPYFVMAVIKTESDFNVNAKSNKNAYGLMQITPTTAEWSAQQMGMTDFSSNKLYDPEYNISMGCWYLGDLQREFGSMDLVCAAYNAGRGNVSNWLNSSKHSSNGKELSYIPFKETDKYVKKVKIYYNIYKWLYSN